MLTPQEVSEHAFNKATLGGYNMANVDDFLDLLTADYTTLYNDNAVLKSKMKVLADKVEEYRSTEDAMRKALLSAQRMADEMVQEAEAKKDAILKEAEAEADRRRAELQKELADEQFRLDAAKKETADYVARIRTYHQQAIAQLEELGELVAPQEEQDSSVSVPQAAMEIDETIQKIIAQEMAAAGTPETDSGDAAEDAQDAEPADGPAAEEPQRTAQAPDDDDDDDDDEPTSRIDFDNLQFGKDFEIT